MKPALKAHWVSQRERHATREALLHVARELVARAGEPALTLGAVADEAGLARATVYGFFAGRGELLAALGPVERVAAAPALAEPDDGIWMNCQPDLNGFLPEAAQGEPAEIIEEPVAVAPEPEPVAQEEPVAVAPEPEPVAQEEPVAVAPEPEPVAQEEPAPEPAPEIIEEPVEDGESHDSADERRRLQASHLEEIAKRLILPESALKEGTDAVISRLDTRIRVLEKSIAGLETRHGLSDAENVKRLKPVADAVDRLQARAEATDAKHLHAVSELRLSIHQLETRIDALEAPTRGAVSEALPSWPEAEAELAPAPVETPHDDETAETDADNPRHAYLSAVRSLAKEGARQAAERESAHEAERQVRRKQMAVAAGIAVVCLGAIGLLFVYHPGAHGVTAADSKVSVASTSPVKPSRAPLDRLTALAEKGDARAELLVGLRYLDRNDALAARWLDRSAGHGNAIAQNALGSLYQSGKGVSGDLARAAHFYELSAAQGNRHAMSNLAVLYAGASDKVKDFAEAARWFQRSAGLGYVDAEFNLAVLYERGDGVPQSLLDAYKWYTIASKAGDAVAKSRADAIATQLSPEELAAAERAASEFKPLPLNLAANDVPALAAVLSN
jgi:TPR repeat protein/outer membrane biosynthesis protein TonB